MAGVSVESGGGKGRRSLDSEINMIPMIDLLMVTISFLLITAVWVHAQRMQADAQVPGPVTGVPPCGAECKEDAKLHVQTGDPTKFTLAWREGRTVVRSVDVPRALPALAASIAREWQASGVHREPSDRRFDKAVVHAPDDMPYSELIAVMDAALAPKREVEVPGRIATVSAFDVTFATD